MKKIILLTAISVSLASCGNQKKDNKSAITIDGSSTVYPITEAIAEEYRAEDPDVDVTIGVSGTGGGFQKFGRGEVAITNASRPIKDDEKAIAESNGISFVELEVAYDGLAVVVHPENDWVSCFTVEQLKKIWEPAAQGTITRWNQIDPTWPDEEIHLFGPGVASGTFDYFTEAIVGKSGSSRGDYTASEDDNVLVQGVSGDKYGLGFFGLAYYEENSDKLKMVPVDGGEGCVEPSTETVSNGTYAPLSRPLFIYVNSSSLENPSVVDFVNFYLTEAPSLLKDVGYIPLTDEEYKREQEKFTSFVEQYNTQQ
ncbi:PstS family phosphate ABC transporter substrate-binding protein [Salinimicrobium oceani]|uniref:Phosphate-binding protein n=1 Tax=Salinimicrobium oceani TaxID=2722702 RepID=A0ABX1CXM4_9FLAO|nr:PstS family phosphate ABC transporter substrate-binding protein [Salinimicrobium oceani]NJW51699.1 PstS family phosphate ABC transporter substrate-binding protein [Salinimicrobium oceani]